MFSFNSQYWLFWFLSGLSLLSACQESASFSDIPRLPKTENTPTEAIAENLPSYPTTTIPLDLPETEVLPVIAWQEAPAWFRLHTPAGRIVAVNSDIEPSPSETAETRVLMQSGSGWLGCLRHGDFVQVQTFSGQFWQNPPSGPLQLGEQPSPKRWRWENHTRSGVCTQAGDQVTLAREDLSGWLAWTEDFSLAVTSKEGNTRFRVEVVANPARPRNPNLNLDFNTAFLDSLTP